MRSDKSTREGINDGVCCYDRVLEKMTEIPENEMLIAMGDHNGRVGEIVECFIEMLKIMKVCTMENYFKIM